jgi:hypothetical protein
MNKSTVSGNERQFRRLTSIGQIAPQNDKFGKHTLGVSTT